ncbi:TetR/AcrR family transcriptional regulator [Streptacidiphilus sp. ASG 303]|uniref:TetR/AcrR family transcriptional regulator n=1 Tax=Streptacidiphilus sp. ASG 303 TaxID=2896847 RepID=UPI001E3C7995|nr:TetR/AcrR family transcriptional regulator [Streptacidiphilus sp. ASG 303]MCD0481370.1 TetR/AcrR family transcriptional regulator [Streptacidiphilus sp. ASG 303]
MARPRRPLLSHDRIVAAALRLVDAEGLEALSTRRLAAELGVSGPSLYNHFATKDDLLDAVADAVVGEVDLSMFGPPDPGLPDPGPLAAAPPAVPGPAPAPPAVPGPAPAPPGAGGPAADWSGALRAWARSYRAALAAHPHVVPVLAQGPGRRPNALRLADAVFGALVSAGWPRAQATRIGALMRYFVTGSALGSFARGFPDDAAVYADRYPHLDQAHLLAERRREIDEGAFETGLEALLDGLALRHPAAGPARPAGPGAPEDARSGGPGGDPDVREDRDGTGGRPENGGKGGFAPC